MSTATKVCRKCGETKELSAFTNDPRTSDKLQCYCRACMREASRLSKAKHKERHAAEGSPRRWHLSGKYGLTPADWEVMLNAQGGVCACCRKTNSNGRPLYVDHCHTTGQVRALLCHTCNSMLGMSDDSSDLLRAGAAYLDLHRSAHRINQHGRREQPLG